jgi:predicted nucleotidyltransferase
VKASHFSRDIRAFLEALQRHEVRFLIVGGEAVIFHGYARLTGDVDLFYDRSGANVSRLFAALLDFWEGDIPGVDEASELADPKLILQFGRPPNRVDLLADLGPVDFATAWAGRVDVDLDGVEAPRTLSYIGLAELLAAKRAAGRAKDLDDIEQLTAERDVLED